MSPDVDFDAVVVGGGPVGLFLGCRLARRGLSFLVLEQREAPPPHSRAIGIHPPALELLGRLGLADRMVARGVLIRGALVRGERGVLGELEFSGVSPYPFILALPQRDTETLLEARLHELRPGTLRRGVSVVDVDDGTSHATVTYRDNAGEVHQVRARFVVGADGHRSLVRQLAGIAYPGRPYQDRYLMGDFEDTTTYGATAVIHVTQGGVVEAFPLPHGKRRWVVRSEPGLREGAEDLCRLIHTRTGLHVPASTCSMLSPFGVGRHLATRFVKGRVVLVGDAAHEVSPIGGQGMNLGLLDAAALAGALEQEVRGEGSSRSPLLAYQRQRRRGARVAARQAEFNMFFGRPVRTPGPRERVLRVMLARPLRPLLARLFTMRWL
ncbi:FAD-dependent oxidoreductase [Deinococcus aestuarii]|uniref:FAD-dependent oxidoreductase n=1 Tax=Deinococcus aestuarii TaxID=2774531 RepID=UPI001C0D821A|nr:NAD(P)/FAD-dependent oxidoreductase [Deinococcus aestuarii]